MIGNNLKMRCTCIFSITHFTLSKNVWSSAEIINLINCLLLISIYYFIVILCTAFDFGDCSIDNCLLYCIVFICFVCYVFFFGQVSYPTVVRQNLWTYEMICVYVYVYVCNLYFGEKECQICLGSTTRSLE